MNDYSNPVIFLPPAGGGIPDLKIFRAGHDDPTVIESVQYPGWQRYVKPDFSAESLIADLADQIEAKIPHGPIRLIGMSIGGHFGYAAALRLQSKGRTIAGFCALDSFMISSAEPTAGWKGRALAEALELLRKRRFSDFMELLRSKFWRALMRLGGNRLPALLARFSSAGSVSSVDPIMEVELSMRLLVRETASWIVLLDHNPVALNAPCVLLRTQGSAEHDEAWRRRCPNLQICEIKGHHYSLLEPENIGFLHDTFVRATKNWRSVHCLVTR